MSGEEDNWETQPDGAEDDWGEEEKEEDDWVEEKEDDTQWTNIPTPKDQQSSCTSPTENEGLVVPSSAVEDLGAAKETLLPKEVDMKKTINSWTDFEVKQFPDLEKMVNEYLKPKLSDATAKAAHNKCLALAVEQNFAKLDQGQMQVFQKELEKMVVAKKAQQKKKEAEAKKEATAAEEAARKAAEEQKKKEAEAKGESYVADEDFFAGLE
ncbi:unnamed protein product [Amoebophrya sp. A25]|nr:unnamed protein product [Amoebophrya sp. A25]|eukprot:GSA25T00026921001.1